jgi:hypothetical protein
VVILVLFAIVPAPEGGEPRVAADDLLFLLVVALIAVALGWLALWLVGGYDPRAERAVEALSGGLTSPRAAAHNPRQPHC